MFFSHYSSDSGQTPESLQLDSGEKKNIPLKKCTKLSFSDGSEMKICPQDIAVTMQYVLPYKSRLFYLILCQIFKCDVMDFLFINNFTIISTYMVWLMLDVLWITRNWAVSRNWPSDSAYCLLYRTIHLSMHYHIYIPNCSPIALYLWKII